MNRDVIYLQHMRDAADTIGEYVAVGHERFITESQWQDAIIRQLEVIGEAAKRVSAETRERYPGVAWRRLAGLRDVLIHQYMSVDIDAVWELAWRQVPELKGQVEEILSSLTGGN